MSPDGLQFYTVDEINDNFPIAKKSKLKSAAPLALLIHTQGKLLHSLTPDEGHPDKHTHTTGEKKTLIYAPGEALYILYMHTTRI